MTRKIFRKLSQISFLAASLFSLSQSDIKTSDIKTMETVSRIIILTLCCSSLLASCSNSKKTNLIDKDGNLHILTREGGKIMEPGPKQIIVRGRDTVVTIDEAGQRKIWISSGATNIDTTKIQYYLKKRNGNNVNIYLLSPADQSPVRVTM